MRDNDAVLPIAHAGHFLWVLYVVPVVIVVISVVRSTLSERRARREDGHAP